MDRDYRDARRPVGPPAAHEHMGAALAHDRAPMGANPLEHLPSCRAE
jgi:hypothetical protein